MKKILFVVPELSHGGSNKCLENLLNLPPFIHADNKVISLGVNEESLPYYKIFGSNLIQMGVLYRIAMKITPIKKILNALHNYLKWDTWGIIYSIEAISLQKKYHFDYVVGFQESYPTHFASHFNVTKIAWIHCDYDDYKIRSNNLNELAWYKKFDKIVCVSKYTSSTFVKSYPLLRTKVQHIYNPLNNTRIQKLAQVPIKDNQIKFNSFTIVSVGRFVEVKQFHRIPIYVKDLLSMNPGYNFQWFIIGDGDKYLWNETTKLIKEYNLGPYIFLLGAKDNPYPYIKQSNLLVSTSRSEACPYVVNEALALGTPVLSLDYPSAKELIHENVGKVVPEIQLAGTLYNLINDLDSVYSRLKESCSKAVYDNTSIVEALERLFSI